MLFATAAYSPSLWHGSLSGVLEYSSKLEPGRLMYIRVHTDDTDDILSPSPDINTTIKQCRTAGSGVLSARALDINLRGMINLLPPYDSASECANYNHAR